MVVLTLSKKLGALPPTPRVLKDSKVGTVGVNLYSQKSNFGSACSVKLIPD